MGTPGAQAAQSSHPKISWNRSRKHRVRPETKLAQAVPARGLTRCFRVLFNDHYARRDYPVSPPGESHGRSVRCLFYMRRWLKRLIKIAAGLVVLAVLALAGLMFTMRWLHGRPVTLPAPAGPHAVGRVEFDWVDLSRAETFGPGRDGKRELDVWVWYPADNPTGAAPAPYLPAAWRAAR